MLVVKSQLTRKNYLKINTLLTVRTLVVMMVIRGVIIVAALRLLRIPSLAPAIVTTVLFVIFQMIALVRSCITPKNRNRLLPCVFIFHEKHFIVSSPLSKETMQWDLLVGWKKVSGHYLLFSTDNHYYCVQESAIENDDREAFKELLEKKVPKKRRFRRIRVR
ncbi:MAG: YcxB family protein [Dehalococcoidales bacterium]|nr:YcxB family protein [Dehalococcoidales bacterium]